MGDYSLRVFLQTDNTTSRTHRSTLTKLVNAARLPYSELVKIA
jgi:hypothetical protein